MIEQINSNPQINRMAAISPFMGIASVISLGFLILPSSVMALPLGLILSNMAILFAHLSKGGGFRFPQQAMVGMGTGFFSLAIYLIMLLISVLSLYLAVQMFGLETVLDPEALQKALNDYLNEQLNFLTTGGGI